MFEDDQIEAAQIPDPSAELKAMEVVLASLQSLERSAQMRVMQWVTSVLSLNSKPFDVIERNSNSHSLTVFDAPTPNEQVPRADSLKEIADLFFAAGPETDPEKALVAAYWHQEILGEPDVDTLKVNTDLKHLGYGIGNITRAFNKLKATRPAQVIQTRKSGSTKQARKRFKVTAEGKKEVERMLASSS